MTLKAYTVLGVAPGATVAEIKTAYRERARQIHPDRFADDPQRAEAAHLAFVELSAAFRTALKLAQLEPVRTQGTQKVRSTVPQPRVPAQWAARPAASTGPARPATPPKRAGATGVAGPADPLLTLLTVPQRCGRAWSAKALEVWALTVVPEARQHLAAADRIARASGVRSDRHLATATAHTLLTLTVDGMNGPRVMGVLGNLDSAYDALEIVLPGEVVDRLPGRVTRPRAETTVGAAEPRSAEPDRNLLAFFAASGALAAATLWTHFFGFFMS